MSNRVGTSMTKLKGAHHCARGKHNWTTWERTGIFDSTERRDCLKCKTIQTRKPKAKRVKP